MSLQPTPINPVPEETARVARAAFPKGNRYLEMRDVLGTIYTDELFADLYPVRGQPAEAPWRLALVTVFQFVEGLSDRQVTDLFFRPLFAFFIVERKSRRVIHVGVTRSPSDPWVAQQLREATPYGQVPKYLIRDNDSKFAPSFARVARTSGIKTLKTPYHAPRANAVCERFLRSVRQECLDHLLILQEKQLQRVLNAYVAYFNQARPHQGIAHRSLA